MSDERSVWLNMSGVSGVFTPIIAFTFILLAIAYSPEFSWTENALSDLGVQEGVTANLFNYGLIISGIFAMIFALGLFVFLREKLLGKIGAFIFVLDVLALIAIGVFPENVKPTHYYVSVIFFRALSNINAYYLRRLFAYWQSEDGIVHFSGGFRCRCCLDYTIFNKIRSRGCNSRGNLITFGIRVVHSFRYPNA